MAAYSISDSLLKLATERMPVPEVILLRGCFASAMLLAIILRTGDIQPRVFARNPRVLVRALFEVLLIVTYVNAIRDLPLGEAVAVIQTTPIFMTAWAAIVWKERVSTGGWLAILAGFIGIMLIVKPSASGISLPMGLAIASSAAAAGRDLITRRISREVPSMMIAFTSVLASALAGLALSLTEEWLAPTAADLAVLAAAAAFVTIANYAIILAYRASDVSVVTPFRYASVLFSLILSFMIWGHIPDLLSWIGIPIVVAAGLYTLTGGNLFRSKQR